jgi:glutamine amidotransferase
MSRRALEVAIVDYGMGNLFSVKRACEHFGMNAEITFSHKEIESADAVILPGVGAFGDAMAALEKLDLVDLLQDIAASNRPLVGICLGIQLLMSDSFEFGHHEGLGIFEGSVVRFDHPRVGSKELKVPQIGWNRLNKRAKNSQKDTWADTPLRGVNDGAFMYFVHSFIVQPKDPNLILSTSKYGHIEFCSSLRRGNIFACQFHPERSGAEGLVIYRNLASIINKAKEEG